MSKLITCPQGHQWELLESGEESTTDLQVLCPVCGAAVDLSQPSEGEPTGAYLTGSNVETLPPPGVGEPVVVSPAEGLAAPPAIPGYEILGALGRGGMGMVYRARQTKLDRLVALKILPPETSRDSNFAERFNREARSLAKLNHANIVTVYDFGQTEGLSYFVMEYVDGLNLRQLLKSGPISPQQTLQIMSQICDALQYAHDEGIVHRDIKPENILRDKRGRVKIADFGIAKLLAPTTRDYTLTGPWQVLGTFHYMAPEQIENPLSLDHRADIYSLGVMFYEMLTGGLPIGRFALPSQKVKMDERIDEVVLKALEKEPERRYQQVRELKAAVDELLGQLGSAIQPVTGPRSTATPSLPGERKSDLTTAPVAQQRQVSKDHVRQRLKGLALGLMVTGCAGISLGLLGLFLVVSALFAVGPRNVSDVVNWMFIAAIIGLLQGSVVVLGARQIQKLEAYQFAVFSSLVAMLPCSPAFLIGLPMGLWALVALRAPEVRAAFHGGFIEAKLFAGPIPKGRFKQLFATSTGWAMLICLIGCAVTFLPWVNAAHLSASIPLSGFETRFGMLTGLGFLILLLLLVATGFIEPIPFWRPLALFIVGIGAIVFPLLLPSVLWCSLREGALIAIGLGLGLLFLGALQIRAILMRIRPPSSSGT